MKHGGNKKSLTIFWFKRDLRLEDNDALNAASKIKGDLLLLYAYEPSIWKDPHYSKRHENFVKESLATLKIQASKLNFNFIVIVGEMVNILEKLHRHYAISTIYSTMETGLDITYQRDIAFAKACKERSIPWIEFQNNGVLRAIQNRDNWRNAWYAYMKKPIATVPKQVASSDASELINFVKSHFKEWDLKTPSHIFQNGGRDKFEEWRDSFFNKRLEYYSAYISKPEMSRYGCSRLSPYISWGVCSIRELYQRAQLERKASSWKKQLVAFTSRLRWQSHFIQKFESEPRMEIEAINSAFLKLPQPQDDTFIAAWKEGKTGYPLVDAALRCVTATGYINFRMRSMIVSFLTHHLFQHFTTGSAWLARQFLDFEPGIHYGQFQMQAGLTGINTVRVYNPVKNALDHDPEAIFIKKWVPELQILPSKFAIEPWLLTSLEEELYGFKVGKSYPDPIVDLKERRAYALKLLYGYRKSPLAQSERLRILEKHTIRRASDKDDSKKI